jgi:predicted ATPase
VTFLFTDIEGSTGLWESAPDAMRTALARHDTIVRGAIEANRGYVFATGGDGLAAAFAGAPDAVAAAATAQAELEAEAWPEGATLRVRMGLHTGIVEERDGNYFGPAVNRAARIMAAGHGAQVLASAATAALVSTTPIADLGEHSFAGLEAPERVYQLGEGSFAPLRSLGAVPTNLPAERSVFVGRERELATVAGLVRSARLVTLTGVGGVGKTRLAIRAASGLAPEFPGGVWIVELAPLIDAALVPSTMASAVGASALGGLDPAEAVCRYLAHRRALVVLDNCEHVIEAAAGLVDRMLGAAPRVRVLATSREALDVVGESAWRVPSLSLDTDDGAGDAVALFAERAAQVLPGFSLTDPAARDAAVAVCRRLDGIPLAIELAAARAKVMSVDQIAAHLDERFRLLTRGGRTAVARQQTLQGAIDWSYELLAAQERGLFETLGVFAGDFDLAAVAAVAGLDEFDVLDLIERLVDKSMVEAQPSRNRYRLLETLRQYAWDRLVLAGRLGDGRDAHAAYFVELAAEQARRTREGEAHTAILDRLEAEYDNLRAALAWLIEEHRADEAARMVHRLIGLFNIRHPGEGYAWLRQVVAIAEGLPARSRARLLGDTAWAAMNAGDTDALYSYAHKAIDVGGDDAPAVAHYLLGRRHLSTKLDYAAAGDHVRRALATARATGDLTTEAMATADLVLLAADLGDQAEVRRLAPEAIAQSERLGIPTIVAVAYTNAGLGLARVGALQEAGVMFERGLVYADAGGPLVASANRVAYALYVEDARDAARIIRPAFPITREHLGGFHLLLPVLVAVKIAAASGDEPSAARLVGAAHGTDFSAYVGYEEYEELVNQVRALMDSSTFEEEFRLGERLNAMDALQLAEEIVAAIA